MIRSYYQKPKKEKRQPTPPPQDNRAEKIADAALKYIGAERFIRSVFKDHVSYISRKYGENWDLTAALVLEMAERERQKATMDTFSFMNLERMRMQLRLPNEAWRYIYEAHLIEQGGDEDKAALIRHWVLKWRTANQFNRDLIPEARKELERLCPLSRRV